MNLAIVVGRLGREPETSVTKAGATVCRLRVATDYKPKDGEARTQWHDVVVWGDSGRACAQYLKSGRLVAIQGRLQTRSWEDESGATKWRTEIVARRVDFLPSGPAGEVAPRVDAPLPF